jgi:hypothetical protein
LNFNSLAWSDPKKKKENLAWSDPKKKTTGKMKNFKLFQPFAENMNKILQIIRDLLLMDIQVPGWKP